MFEIHVLVHDLFLTEKDRKMILLLIKKNIPYYKDRKLQVELIQ